MKRVIINIKLPEQIRIDFKTACAHQKTNMQVEVEAMICRFIKWEQSQREPENPET